MCKKSSDKSLIFSLLLMVVMVFNITTTTLFVHSHNIDGRDIVHSHPYTGAATSHSHSSAHADLISRIASPEMLAAAPEAPSFEPIARLNDGYCDVAPQLIAIAIPSLALRAPPCAA